MAAAAAVVAFTSEEAAVAAGGWKYCFRNGEQFLSLFFLLLVIRRHRSVVGSI